MYQNILQQIFGELNLTLSEWHYINLISIGKLIITKISTVMKTHSCVLCGQEKCAEHSVLLCELKLCPFFSFLYCRNYPVDFYQFIYTLYALHIHHPSYQIYQFARYLLFCIFLLHWKYCSHVSISRESSKRPTHPVILMKVKAGLMELYAILFKICCHAYHTEHWCYAREIFIKHLYTIESGLF